MFYKIKHSYSTSLAFIFLIRKFKQLICLCDKKFLTLHIFTPAFLSFLFLYTDRMTRRFPTISATVVKMSTPARVAATPGDVLFAARHWLLLDKLSIQLKFAILRDHCNATIKFHLSSPLPGKKQVFPFAFRTTFPVLHL